MKAEKNEWATKTICEETELFVYVMFMYLNNKLERMHDGIFAEIACSCAKMALKTEKVERSKNHRWESSQVLVYKTSHEIIPMCTICFDRCTVKNNHVTTYSSLQKYICNYHESKKGTVNECQNIKDI